MASFDIAERTESSEALAPPDQARVVAHYERFVPLIAATFGGIPVTTVYLPEGFDGPEERVSQPAQAGAGQDSDRRGDDAQRNASVRCGEPVELETALGI